MKGGGGRELGGREGGGTSGGNERGRREGEGGDSQIRKKPGEKKKFSDSKLNEQGMKASTGMEMLPNFSEALFWESRPVRFFRYVTSYVQTSSI